jgi:hypothetical protein
MKPIVLLSLSLIAVFLVLYLPSCNDYPDEPYDTGTGDNTSSGHSPNLVITTPSDSGEVVRDTFIVKWSCFNMDGDKVSLNLYYDTDKDISKHSGIIAEGLDINDSQYNWILSNIPSGYYYILGTLVPKSGSNVTKSLMAPLLTASQSSIIDYDYSSYPLLVVHNMAPSMTFTSPDSGVSLADTSFVIKWTTYDKEHDTCYVNLYYDTDRDTTNGFGGVLAQAMPDTGSLKWDTSYLSEEDFYIYGEVYDNNVGSNRRLISKGYLGYGKTSTYSKGLVRVKHSSYISIKMLTPPMEGAYAKTKYQLKWESTGNEAKNYMVSLYYDDDLEEANGYAGVIKEFIPDTSRYIWEFSNVQLGDYYILGKLVEVQGKPRSRGVYLNQQGQHKALNRGSLFSRGLINRLVRVRDNFSYSDGPLHVVDNMPPTFMFIKPPPEGASASDTYRLEWMQMDEENDSIRVSLSYDDDNYAWNGTGGTITEEIPSTGFYEWDLAGVPEGTYYICATVNDGHHKILVYSMGTFTKLP